MVFTILCSESFLPGPEQGLVSSGPRINSGPKVAHRFFFLINKVLWAHRKGL